MATRTLLPDQSSIRGQNRFTRPSERSRGETAEVPIIRTVTTSCQYAREQTPYCCIAALCFSRSKDETERV